MPELIYPTSTELRGPILISAASLKELDGILAEQMQTLRDLQKQMVEEAVAKETREKSFDKEDIEQIKDRVLKGFLGENHTSLVVYLSNGSRLKTHSFEEAAAHAEVSRNLATSFDLEMQCGKTTLRMHAESTSFGTELSLDVSPSSSEAAVNVFSAIRRWLRKIQAPRWQQWWCAAGHLWFAIWMVFFFAVAIVLAVSQGDSESNYYKEQARQLVKKGVTPDQPQKAIETLLALQGGSPAPTEHRAGNWFWFFLIGGIIVCFILSYPPKLVLGLGVGEDRIGYWRTWTRFVFVIVPTFVASNFLWPVVSEGIKRLATR